MGAMASAVRVAVGIVVGVLLAGVVVGVVVPARPDAVGPAAAFGLTIVCVGAVVWADWQFLRKR